MLLRYASSRPLVVDQPIANLSPLLIRAPTPTSPQSPRKYRAGAAYGLAPSDNALVVWDPITNEEVELPKLPLDPFPYQWGLNGAVLCAAGSRCKHLDCSHGPFLVVLLAISRTESFACVYSSEDGAWSEPTYFTQHINEVPVLAPAALVGNDLYFLLFNTARVLKYDVTTGEMNVIHLPSITTDPPHYILLTATEDGNTTIQMHCCGGP
ncbi:hypothetical protein EJB05_14114, partial [Eragrostis curvula]